VLGKRQRIVHVPFWVIDAAVALIRPFNRNAAGFLEFFRQTAARDMVGTPVGEHSLKDFYSSLAHETKHPKRAPNKEAGMVVVSAEREREEVQR